MLFRYGPKKKKHLKGLLRATLYLVVVQLIAGTVQLRHAHGEVKSQTIEVGRRMLELAKSVQHDVTEAKVNGETIWVGSSTSEDSVKTVLDRYEGHCRSEASHASSSWRDLAGKDATHVGLLDGLGVMRSGDDTEGTVLCFTRGERSAASISEGILAFGATGELGAIGNLRYAYARTSQRGGTVLLSAWTETSFNVMKLTPPAEGDAPGDEFPEVPRPPTSTRMFSARLEGAPYGLNVYRARGTPAAVVGFYTTSLEKAGWHAIDPQAEEYMSEDMKANSAVVRLYSKDGIILTLSAHRDEDDGYSIAGLGMAGAEAHE